MKIRDWLARVLIIMAVSTLLTHIVMTILETIPGMELSTPWKIGGPAIAAFISGLVTIKIVMQMMRIKALHHELSQAYTELRQAHAQLEALTSIDQMTGLTNRDAFFRAIQPQSLHSGWLILCDVDHFKQVNDTHGHATGDRVLAAIGEIIHANVRNGDGLSARIGGEEFVILLPSMPEHQIVAITERLREAISKMEITSLAGQPIRVTMSFGVACREKTPVTDLLKIADAALYEAKNNGRNRVVLAAAA